MEAASWLLKSGVTIPGNKRNSKIIALPMRRTQKHKGNLGRFITKDYDY